MFYMYISVRQSASMPDNRPACIVQLVLTAAEESSLLTAENLWAVSRMSPFFNHRSIKNVAIFGVDISDLKNISVDFHSRVSLASRPPGIVLKSQHP